MMETSQLGNQCSMRPSYQLPSGTHWRKISSCTTIRISVQVFTQVQSTNTDTYKYIQVNAIYQSNAMMQWTAYVCICVGSQQRPTPDFWWTSGLYDVVLRIDCTNMSTNTSTSTNTNNCQTVLKPDHKYTLLSTVAALARKYSCLDSGYLSQYTLKPDRPTSQKMLRARLW